MAIRGFRTKLYRNLKEGDKFSVMTGYGIKPYRYAVVTVTKVQETRRAYFSGKRQWEVHGNYPWWFNGPVVAYSDERVDLV